MDITKCSHIYFSGIGGIGMSALAAYFNAKGVRISGYDRTPSAITHRLSESGVEIHYNEDINMLSEDIDIVVYTPAIPADSIELAYFREKNIPVMKRSDVLSLITANMFTVAVAGTHGKTSITSLISHILKYAGKEIDSFIGGISRNFSSNLVMSGSPEMIVVEADEFDRSFLKLEPDVAVISSIDPDHLDIYGNYEELSKTFSLFAHKLKTGGKLVCKYGLNVNIGNNASKYNYSGVTDSADSHFCALNMQFKDGKYSFDLKLDDKLINDVYCGIPGLHNIENSVAASAVCYLLGVEPLVIKEALALYKGVERRFDFRINTPGLVFVDDYAHHPAEISSCLKSLKHIYPDLRLTAVFQPHLYTRTRDLLTDFARSLEIADEVILLDIYPAREKPIPGITSTLLLSKICGPDKKLLMREELLEYLVKNPPELLVTMGAGDIDRLVKPIEEVLSKKLAK